MLAQLKSSAADNIGRVAAKAALAPRLLVIDDDSLHRTILCRVAAKAGYALATAATYEQAVELTQATAFDCITLDLSLGQHDGIEMLQHLHAIGCQTPIIIVSGCDGATCREALRAAKALKLNVLETVPKPVDVATLRFSLERLRRLGNLACSAATVYA